MLGVDFVMYRLVKPGVKPATKCLQQMAGNGVDSIFIGVGSPKGKFEIDCSDRNPMIYTGNARPKKGDLTFIKNLIVHLIDIRNDDEFFLKWVSEALNSKPKMLLATDSTGELYTWNT